MLPAQPDIFTRISWYAFQVALLVLFIRGLIKFLKSVW